MRIRKTEVLGPGDVDLDELGGQLPVVVFAQAAAEVELDVQPDDDRSAALATAQDRADRLAERAAGLNEIAARLTVEAELLRLASPECDDQHESIVTADASAARAQRSYLDARTRADEAWRVVADIDPSAAEGRADPDLWLGNGEGNGQGEPNRSGASGRRRFRLSKWR